MYARRLDNRILDYIFLILATTFALSIAYLRPGFGVDEPSYLDAFIDFKSNAETFPFDYSFKVLYTALSSVGVEDEYFNKVVSSLYIILLSITAIKTSNKNNKCLYFLMLFFSFTSLDLMFNAYRQAFAFIFVYNALFLFLRGKRIKGGGLAVVSFGFHWSAAILILFYFLSRFIKDKTSYFILLLLFPFVFVSMVYPLGLMGIGYYILSILPLNESFKAHVLAYLEVDNISNASFYILNVFGRLPLAISVLSFYAFILIFYKEIKIKRTITMVVLMSVYCLVFMEMAYSFRNYYWILPFFPIVVLDYAESNQNKNSSRMMGIAALHILIALPTFYSSGINSMIFTTGN